MPGQLREPRGLLHHRRRRALIVADTGNHRLQLFELATMQLVGVWGQSLSESEPRAGDEPGRFKRPTALAGDAAGNVYVVDAGNRRVQKFDARGLVQPSFWDKVRAHSPRPQTPVGVAVDPGEPDALVYVLDAAPPMLLAYSKDGTFQFAVDIDPAVKPLGLAADRDSIYVGDNGHFRVQRYRTERGAFVGEGRDELAVAGLAFDGRGNLVVVSGDGSSPIVLSLNGGHVVRGLLWGGPFNNPSGRPYPWHLLAAHLATALPPGAHLQLLLATSRPPVYPQPGSAPWDGGASTVCTLERLLGLATPKCEPGQWVRVPLDAPECLFPGDPVGPVWVGVELQGNGTATAALTQLRLDFDHETYLQFLPAAYRDDAVSESFLARFLTLFESRFRTTERKITGQATLLDPAAAPDAALDALADLVGVEPTPGWSAARKRRVVRGAFAAEGRRGTATGLRQALWGALGVVSYVEEPILQTNWWCLPPVDAMPGSAITSVLGVTTGLAGSDPQGAVLGTTATLDQSQLLTSDEYGMGLFQDVAHRFTVWVYAPWSDDRTLAAVRAFLDRERPAHTTYGLGVIQPALRLGFQARVGIDTVVAGPEPTAASGFRLAGGPTGRIGSSRVGESTRLGSCPLRPEPGH
jgi:phage tail-like protein